MAIPPHTPIPVEEAFTADRAMFWQRFTKFTKNAVIGVIVLLLILLVFVY